VTNDHFWIYISSSSYLIFFNCLDLASWILLLFLNNKKCNRFIIPLVYVYYPLSLYAGLLAWFRDFFFRLILNVAEASRLSAAVSVVYFHFSKNLSVRSTLIFSTS